MIFQLFGAVKAVVFFTPLPVNVSIPGSLVEELVVDAFEGVIEGVSANLGVAVGSGAIVTFVVWFVFVVCGLLDPKQAVQMSTKPTIPASMKKYRPDLLKEPLTGFASLFDCCL
jgi:hypothetical protein